MEQYLKKSALVAEIESKRNDYINSLMTEQVHVLNDVLDFLDTLEVKESLTWQDIRLISEIGEDFMNSEESDNLNEEEYYQSILNKFKAQKGE